MTSISTESFGTDYTLYTISNRNGTQVKVTDLGGTIVSLIVSDKDGKKRDVVLGYDTPEEYLNNKGFLGAWVGRSCNRIDKARFTIDGKEYRLAVNDNENNLHSGPDTFNLRKMEGAVTMDHAVSFTVRDNDLRQGYPGNFVSSVTYRLTEDNALSLSYIARCDQDTVCNMTNHTYFNLGGHDSGSIEDTIITLFADRYTPVKDYQSIPTGECRSVEGTVFDFTSGKEIGRDIESDEEQLRFVGGYDHNFIIQPDKGDTLEFARAFQPRTGILMDCYTDLPGVQFYTSNSLADVKGKGGAEYHRRNGFCLETQYYPNSINQEGFASPLLKAGEEYRSVTVYRFSVT